MSGSSGSARVPRAAPNMRVSVIPRTRRTNVNDLIFRTSPGPDQTIPDTPPPADSVFPSANLFSVARPEGRTAQPGNYRLGEQGVITSGRVIPVSTVQQSHSSNNSSQNASSQPNLITIRRVMRRKDVVYPPVRSNIATARLLKEAQQIGASAPPGCYAAPKADDLFDWAAVIEGPPDTVYAGGIFFFNINMKNSYPFHPPKIVFLTKIYHCNINAKGEVCVDLLRDKWKSTMTVATVLQSILSLLYQCNPDDALVTSIGCQYKEDREQFEKTARIWTTRYAS
ncbi:unnamed protein product [Auanema sp. JU1783]|nr:unnamed protein product [Auanema sp. JU1783]